MVAVAEPEAQAAIRDSEPGDLPYVVTTWRKAWQLWGDNRRMPGAAYRAYFDQVIRHGVLARPDTRIVIACDSVATDVILGFCCYTPGSVPVIHFCAVRRAVRRRGILWVMLAAAGLRDAGMAYTARPADRERIGKWNTRKVDLEAPLLRAFARRGIPVLYQSIDDFLNARMIQERHR